ncbi:MAG TPA: glycosyltransferase [Longimicrobiales bacterium]
MKKRSVLIIGPTPPPVQGMAVFTEMLLRSPALRAAYTVLHLDTADRRSLENMGRFDLTNVRLALVHAGRLAALVVRHRPDVVYIEVSQNAWAYLRDSVLMAIARLAGCRVVTHLHGSHFREFYTGAIAPVRWWVRRTSRWLSVAAVLGEGLRSLYAGLVPPERVLVAPAGVPDPFPEGVRARDRAGAEARAVTVTYLGALFRPKGFLDLLDAAARLRDAEPPVRFILAGGWVSDAEREEAVERVRAHGLEDVVDFPGVVAGDAKRALWLESDIFVFPGYQAEGLPLVVLEAMAAALPVIATPMGAIPDAVADGISGILVPPRDPSHLADAIGRLAREPALRERMGRAGRARFLDAYTDDRCIERLIAVLDAACGGLEAV